MKVITTLLVSALVSFGVSAKTVTFNNGLDVYTGETHSDFFAVGSVIKVNKVGYRVEKLWISTGINGAAVPFFTAKAKNGKVVKGAIKGFRN